VRGPGVAGFGIIGRSYSGKPADQILLDHRAQADAEADQQALLKESAKIAFQNSWENTLVSVGQKGDARRATQQQQAAKKEQIEARREKFD
jgi:hypothetical protein